MIRNLKNTIGGFILSIILTAPALAQSWERLQGSLNNETRADGLIAMPDGGAVLSTTSQNGPLGGGDFLVTRYDANGNVLWNVFHGTPGIDDFGMLYLDANGNIILAGYTLHPSANGSLIVLQIDPATGLENWEIMPYDSTPNTYGVVPHSISQDDNGNYLVAGQTSSYVNGTLTILNGCVISVNAGGTAVNWFRGFANMNFTSLAKVGANTFIVSGGQPAANLVAYSMTISGGLPSFNWSRVYTLGNNVYTLGYFTVQLANGDLAMLGGTNHCCNATRDMVIVRTNAQGLNPVAFILGTNARDGGYFLTKTPQNNLVISGNQGAPPQGFWVEMDPYAGTVLQAGVLNGPSMESIYNVAVDASGTGWFVSAQTNSVQFPGENNVNGNGLLVHSSNVVSDLLCSVNVTIANSPITANNASSIVTWPFAIYNDACGESVTPTMVHLPCMRCTLPVATILNGNAALCEGASHTLTTISSGTYSWAHNGVPIAAPNGTGINLSLTNLTLADAGTYSVTITDGFGCTASAQTSLQVNARPQVSISGNVIGCNGGTFTLAASGAVNYLWDGGQTGNPITANAVGAYSVTGTDANGCTGAASVTTSILPPPTITISGGGTICNGGTATFSATGGTQYLWSNNETTASITANVLGTYSVTGTDANGCTNSASVALTASVPPLVAVNGDGFICGGELSVLTASGADSYVWGTGETANAISVGAAGTYVVTGTNASGCTASASFALAINPSPMISLNGATSICNNDSSVISATGAVGYVWNTGATGNTITANAPGSYTVTGTAANGCTNTASLVVAPAQINLLIHGGYLFCDSLPAQLNASGAVGYYWNTGETTSSIIADSIGTYSVTGTDANGCTSTASISVANQAHLSINAYGLQNASCPYSCDGVASVLANGGTPFVFGHTYSWSNGQVSPSATGLCVGTYTVTATDVNGCSVSTTINIEAPPSILTNITTTPISCYGGSDGSATASVSGGTPGYIYTWSNANVGPSQPHLPSGSIEVTITDSNGCTASAASYVASPNPLFGNPFMSNASCYGLGNGAIALNPSGGTSPYTYAWDNGQTTAFAVGLTAGQLLGVTFTDANGCSGSINGLTVGEPLPVSANANVVANNPCAGSAQGVLAAVASGGTPPFAFEWSTYQLGDTLMYLPSGTYMVTATDANGCSATSTASISAPEPLLTNYLWGNVICNGESTGSIEVDTILGGTPPYSLSLDGIQYYPDIDQGYLVDNLPAGAYTFYVQDAQGCSDTAQIILTEPDPLVVNAGADTVLQLGEQVGIDAYVLNPYEGLIWEWVPPLWLNCSDCLNPIASPLETTQYILTWTDSNGCSGSDEVKIDVIKNRNVFIPNAFTPNGDDLNDLFTVYGGMGVGTVLKMLVFDRWGELIYETHDFRPSTPGVGWDGSFRGKAMNPSIFVYLIEIEFVDGVRVQYKGDFSLIR